MRKKLWLLLLLTFCITIGSVVPSFAELPQAPDTFYLDQLGVLSEETKKNITDTNIELDHVSILGDTREKMEPKLFCIRPPI